MTDRLPDGWRLKTLGEAATNVAAKYIPDPLDHFRYVGLEHIAPDSHCLTKWGHSTEAISTKGVFRESDTLFGKLRPYLRKVAYANFDGVCSTDILILRAGPELIPTFLFRVLSSEGAIKHSVESSAGNVMPRTSWKDMADFQFPVPPKPEQQKIASVLTSVDEVIEKTEAQISKLHDLKDGMMQELLTKGIGHTEFKDSPVGRIPQDWDVSTYREVLSRIDSGWSPNCIEKPPVAGQWGVLKVSAVTRGKFIESESKTLPSEIEPREPIRIAKGDILLTRANGVAELVGKCVKVDAEPKSKLMMSDKILRLSPSRRIYPDFLLHVFNSDATRRQIENSWGGSSGQKNISQADIKSFYLPLPPLNEQQSIGAAISSTDRRIIVTEQKLQRQKSIKKALMQDLLTGKVRVKVN